MKLQEALKTDKFNSPQHMASLNVLYSAYWLKTHVCETLKGLKLTFEQFNVLRILNGKHPEPMCVRDIGSRMIEKSSNVPRIIDRLVVKKLVKRTPSKIDKRETLISLTKEGLKTLEKANDNLNTFSERLFGLSDEQALQLNELLERFRIIDETI